MAFLFLADAAVINRTAHVENYVFSRALTQTNLCLHQRKWTVRGRSAPSLTSGL